MQSFDELIEKYSRELIETKSRSILQAIDEVISETFEEKEESEIESQAVAAMAAPDEESGGRLKVQVFAAERVYPVSNVEVSVYKTKSDDLLFRGYTDSSGEISEIILPAPSRNRSDAPSEIKPYYQYDITVSHPGFIRRKYIGVPVFEGIESIQSVQLIPTDNGVDYDMITTETEPNDLLLSEGRG